MNDRNEWDDLAFRELMAAHQAGDPTVFERLYRTLKPHLTQYLGALAREDDRTAELVQQTFLHIHKARRSYNRALPFRPWAFAIARNVFLMDRRARSRRMRWEVMPEPGEVEHSGDEPQFLSLRLLQELLSRVSSECRDLLELRYLAGLDFRQIGAHLGLQPVTARVRLCRALAELRRIVQEPCD
jgi:RNA polymerase sigma-70 factor, ECF subfamily